MVLEHDAQQISDGVYTNMLIQALKQRGYEVTMQGGETDILLPKTEDAATLDALKEILYSLMTNAQFRKNFRDWAYGHPIDGESFKTIEAYIAICMSYDENLGNIHIKPEEKTS